MPRLLREIAAGNLKGVHNNMTSLERAVGAKVLSAIALGDGVQRIDMRVQDTWEGNNVVNNYAQQHYTKKRFTVSGPRMIMTLEFVFEYLDPAFGGDLQAALDYLSILSPVGAPITQRQANVQRLEASHDTHLELNDTGGTARDCNHLHMVLESPRENKARNQCGSDPSLACIDRCFCSTTHPCRALAKAKLTEIHLNERISTQYLLGMFGEHPGKSKVEIQALEITRFEQAFDAQVIQRPRFLVLRRSMANIQIVAYECDSDNATCTSKFRTLVEAEQHENSCGAVPSAAAAASSSRASLDSNSTASTAGSTSSEESRLSRLENLIQRPQKANKEFRDKEDLELVTRYLEHGKNLLGTGRSGRGPGRVTFSSIATDFTTCEPTGTIRDRFMKTKRFESFCREKGIDYESIKTNCTGRVTGCTCAAHSINCVGRIVESRYIPARAV